MLRHSLSTSGERASSQRSEDGRRWKSKQVVGTGLITRSWLLIEIMRFMQKRLQGTCRTQGASRFSYTDDSKSASYSQDHYKPLSPSNLYPMSPSPDENGLCEPRVPLSPDENGMYNPWQIHCALIAEAIVRAVWEPPDTDMVGIYDRNSIWSSRRDSSKMSRISQSGQSTWT